MRIFGPAIQSVFLAAALIVAWQLMVDYRIWDPTIVPSPISVAAAVWEFRNLLAKDAITTVAEIALGFAITVASAIITAVAIHLLPRSLQGIYGLLIVIQSVPLWGIAPVLFYWTGPGLTARIIVIVLTAFFPVLVNTVEGLERVDSDLVDLFNSMNASPWQSLSKLELPSALFMVLAGSKITLTLCVIGAVLAEMMIGDMLGLGYRIKSANAHFRLDLVFASIVLLGGIATVFYAALTLVARIHPGVSKKEH